MSSIRPNVKPTKEELENLLKAKISLDLMGQRLGCSSATVSKWIKFYNLKKEKPFALKADALRKRLNANGYAVEQKAMYTKFGKYDRE